MSKLAAVSSGLNPENKGRPQPPVGLEPDYLRLGGTARAGPPVLSQHDLLLIHEMSHAILLQQDSLDSVQNGFSLP